MLKTTKAQAIRRGTTTVRRILLHLIRWNKRNEELVHPADVVNYTLTRQEIEILKDFEACLSIYTIDEEDFCHFTKLEKAHHSDYDIVLCKGYRNFSYDTNQTNYEWDVSLESHTIVIKSRSAAPAHVKVTETIYKICLLDIYKILYPNTKFA